LPQECAAGLGFVVKKGECMEKRLGFVGILIENRKKVAPQVNQVLSEFGDCIIGRMGIPHAKKDLNVITLIVDASTDELGALTGKLGKLPGVSVKSALGKR
jgi:putative iron-only hydrogenase system regulator